MKFKLTFTAVREFEVPEGATDEEYDQLKELAKMAMSEMDIKPDMFTVERIDVPDVVNYLIDNFDLQEDTVTVQGNEIAVLSGNGKDGFLKVVTGDDNKVYIEFLDDNGINSIKPGALITSFDDIEEALA